MIKAIREVCKILVILGSLLPLLAFAAVSEKEMQEIKVRICEVAGFNPGKIVLVNEPVENAYTNITGKVYIYQGMLDACQTPDEIAGVYAHELSHILNKDIYPNGNKHDDLTQEKLADMKGRKLMEAAGYSPQLMAQYWLRCVQAGDISGGPIHPDNDIRYTFWMTGLPYRLPANVR